VLIAITRKVSSSLALCELTHLSRTSINIERARAQHHDYEACLAELVDKVIQLDEEADLPDAVFVEDTCVVLDELAVITRPGAPSRRPETASVGQILGRYRTLHFIEAPGTVDGGDVLRLGRTLFVGKTSRSNDAGIEQLRAFVKPAGYDVVAVTLRGCLHLKSAATAVAERTVLLNPGWVDARLFEDFAVVSVDPSEPAAGNALLVSNKVVFPASYPKTRERLELANIHVEPVDLSEFAKAEGGVTCCSVIFQA